MTAFVHFDQKRRSFKSNSGQCAIIILLLNIFSKYKRHASAVSGFHLSQRLDGSPVAQLSDAFVWNPAEHFLLLSLILSQSVPQCRKKKSEHGGGSGPSYLLEVWEGSGLLACSSWHGSPSWFLPLCSDRGTSPCPTAAADISWRSMSHNSSRTPTPWICTLA